MLLQIQIKNLQAFLIATMFFFTTLYAIVCSPPLKGEVYTWVDGRFYIHQFQESHNQTNADIKYPTQGLYGDVVVNYYHDSLPYGSRIEILFGLGGTENSGEGQPLPISWENSGSVEAKAIGPYVWSAHIARSLAQYDGQRQYQRLEFCVRITLPQGVIFDPHHCRPEQHYLEAKIPWESVPQVDIQHAHWRRLPHAVKKSDP